MKKQEWEEEEGEAEAVERGTGGSRAKDIPVSSQHQSGGKEEEEEEATIDVSSLPPCARVSVGGERSSHFLLLLFLFHNHTRHHHTCGLRVAADEEGEGATDCHMDAQRYNDC